MKKWMVLGAIFLVGCDQAFDYIENKNAPPVVTITGYENGVKEVVLTARAQSGKEVVKSITLKMEDTNKNLDGFMLTLVAGQVSVMRNGEVLAYNTLHALTSGSSATEEWDLTMSGVGESKVKVSILDVFGKSAELMVGMAVVANAKPIAVLKISEGQNNDYILDGSGSYDSDANLGGSIAGYRFGFLSKTFTTTKSSTGVVFTLPGTYRVSLVVIDNNGLESDEVTQNITIE